VRLCWCSSTPRPLLRLRIPNHCAHVVLLKTGTKIVDQESGRNRELDVRWSMVTEGDDKLPNPAVEAMESIQEDVKEECMTKEVL
jgi:hypothetical protein